MPSSSRRLGPLEITLIVIDVVLIGVLIFLLATQPDGPDEQPTETASSTAAEGGTGEDASSAEPSSTQAVTVPEGALDLAEFAAPSGNIWCTITDDAATCQIATIEYEPPAIANCEDNDLAGKILRVSGETAEYPCPSGSISGPEPGDRDVLDYGETTHVGDYMCTSTQEGVSCTDITTGASFSVRRAGATVSPAS